ncbi:BamA/TamA family outer membrane protein [Rheinheimera sp.]|uniref:BamA/TamA family outer membrane protein n=1 Tax=Rheinheimera sp. TaxID=1869214 RepID=UPI002355B806|nr:BamA/TamA family outer membrane protein [Rheinheimera sp.]|tara:strand:- start:507 stop:2123 length:1617 start_codon:yes stop_codon:yes gene_type:complete
MKLAVSSALLLISAGYARAECQAVADNQFLVNESDVTIHSVTYSPNNVFDLTDKDSFWLHEFANYTHTVTRESVLADDLLFQAGDKLHLDDLAETERLLRSRRYLREAEVRISHYCADSNSVIVNVATWDNWSLLPTLDFSSEGGRSKSAIGFEEDNLLGTGNRLSLEYKHESERTGLGFMFFSPNMFGSFWNSALGYSKNSDGNNYQLSVQRPFYRLASPWALGFEINRVSEDVIEYDAGDEYNRYQRQHNHAKAEFGYKLNISGNNIHRLKAAFELDNFKFYETSETLFGAPQNRNLTGYWLEYEFIQADYKKLFNIQSFNRTEDFNFGWQLNARLGQYSKPLGADDNAVFWQLTAAKNWQLADDLWLLSDASWTQREFEQTQYLFSTHWQLVKQLSDYSSLVGKLALDKGENLFRDEPLYIGGEDQLRAYPEYFRSGESRTVVTAEYRRYTDWSLWQLLDVAFAGYIDAGKIWQTDEQDANTSSGGTLVGIGGGVRLLSNHSSRGTMIHMDITKALTDNDNLNSVEFRVTATKSF